MLKLMLIGAIAFSIWLITASGTIEKGREIPCDDERPRVVRIVPGRITVLNFPFKPKDVVPGNAAFDFKQIKNDLVIMATKQGAHTNAVIYLEERRCTFDLIA